MDVSWAVPSSIRLPFHLQVSCLSLGPPPREASALRARAQRECARFVDLHAEDDAAAAAEASTAHILLDLNFVKGGAPRARNAVIAHAAAPLRVNLVAHPVHMGTHAAWHTQRVHSPCAARTRHGTPTAPPQATAGGAYQYVLADTAAAPPRLATAFAERLVLAPHHFQPNSLSDDALAAGLPRDGARNGARDGTHAHDVRLLTRAELGLSAAAPLLAMSGNPAKLSPETAAVAAGALLGAPRAVLLLVSYPMAARGAEVAQRARLRAELAARGAPLSRVRFVPLVPTASHLRRVGRASPLHV